MTDRTCFKVQCQPPTHLTTIIAQACISHLRGLTNLQVAHIGVPYEAASLDNTLACLPVLEVVSLEFREASEPHADPIPQDVFPCSLLRLAAVKSSQATPLHRSHLLFHMYVLHPPRIVPPDAYVKSGIHCCRCTRLTSMDLIGFWPSEYACSVPAGITALQHLQHLGLRNCVTAPLPRSLSQMTRLTSLDVTQESRLPAGQQLFRDSNDPVVCCVIGNSVRTSCLAVDVADFTCNLRRLAVLMCADAVM
jgi:hypothetical protein